MGLFAIIIVVVVGVIGLLALPVMKATTPLIESASDFVERLEKIQLGRRDPGRGQLSEPVQDRMGALSDRRLASGDESGSASDMTLNAGDSAPDFEVKDHNNNTVKLSELAGKAVVLWFYPRADTPG